MGITRVNGYSASVKGFVVIGDVRLRLAKTNGVTFSLSEPSSVKYPPRTLADLEITIDGAKDSKRISLSEGVSLGQSTVRYDETVPF